MLRVYTNHAHHTLPVHQLALVAHFLYRCSHFHNSKSSNILPRVLSRGDNSTRTRSPRTQAPKIPSRDAQPQAVLRANCSITSASTGSALTAGSEPTGR